MTSEEGSKSVVGKVVGRVDNAFKFILASIAIVFSSVIISVVMLTFMTYRIDCNAGDASSTIEVRDQFRLELVCPKKA